MSTHAGRTDATPTSRTVAEGLVRAPPAPRGTRSPARLIAGAAGVAVVVVVGALAFSGGGAEVADRPRDPTGPKRHLVVRDEPSDEAPPTAAEAPPAEEKPDTVALEEEPGQMRKPESDAKADDKPAPSKAVTVSLIAPHDVTWTTASGRAVGRGTTRAKLGPDDKALVAVDAQRGGRSTIPVAARMDWYSLPRGTLEIYVKGAAERVKLGKEVLGRPPLRPISAVVGTYSVVVELKGGKSVKAVAKVKPKETTVVTVDPSTAK